MKSLENTSVCFYLDPKAFFLILLFFRTFKTIWKLVAQNLDNYVSYPRLIGGKMNGQSVAFLAHIKFKRLRCEMHVHVSVNSYVVDLAYCFLLGM